MKMAISHRQSMYFLETRRHFRCPDEICPPDTGHERRRRNPNGPSRCHSEEDSGPTSFVGKREMLRVLEDPGASWSMLCELIFAPGESAWAEFEDWVRGPAVLHCGNDTNQASLRDEHERCMLFVISLDWARHATAMPHRLGDVGPRLRDFRKRR